MDNSKPNRLDQSVREPLLAIVPRVKTKTKKRIARLKEEVDKLSDTLDRAAARQAKISGKR